LLTVPIKLSSNHLILLYVYLRARQLRREFIAGDDDAGFGFEEAIDVF